MINKLNEITPTERAKLILFNHYEFKDFIRLINPISKEISYIIINK